MLIRAWLLALGALAAVGCAGDRSTTSGGEVRLRTALTADPELDAGFETALGWSVRLTRAAVSIAALYYFDGEPAFARRRPGSAWQHLAGLLGPSVARAHPGHYLQGGATGQMTEPQHVELSTARLALPDGRGITGLYRSARLVLAEAADTQIDGLDGSVAFAQGVATKGAQSVHFRLSASFADVARSVRDGEVNGCVFEAADVKGDGTVTLTVAPRVWFELVDFSEIAPGSESEPTPIASGDTAQLAFALGVVQLSAYRFSFQGDE